MLIEERDFLPTALLPFVTPIFKEREDPRNYRLVSLTLIPGKVMKQIILGTTSKHMKDKKVIVSRPTDLSRGNHVYQPDSLL